MNQKEIDAVKAMLKMAHSKPNKNGLTKKQNKVYINRKERALVRTIAKNQIEINKIQGATNKLLVKLFESLESHKGED